MRFSVVLGTHGTALSTILNYFDPTYNYESFYRIIDFMPYIIRLDFEGAVCVGKEEILAVKKEFKGSNRADKPH
jgi:2,3-bisphosphoglycerate-dependent phosphoglycerate mutase